jgi:dTMP kinase
MNYDLVSRGRFITVEGVEGVGKSTQLTLLETWLRARDIDLLMTREPGGSPLAEEIRKLLLTPRDDEMAPDAELLLVFAARADHLASRIVPALERGQWVISDRFTDASFAYQGAGRGIKPERIEILEQWTQGELRPDRVIVLDLPPEEGARRVQRRAQPDRFEREQLDFFHRARDMYLARAQANPSRYRVIDAHGEQNEVHRRITEALGDLL